MRGNLVQFATAKALKIFGTAYVGLTTPYEASVAKWAFDVAQ